VQGVDVLEAVEVGQDHAHARIAGHVLVQPLQKRAPVGQVGERIAQRERARLLAQADHDRLA
jgi:hypothetical protein